jgi:hypothetical protein
VKTCDIFLLEDLTGSSKLLKQLRIFQPGILFDDDQTYSGFLGLNVNRIKAVAIVAHFRNNAIRCLNIPVRYRDGKLLSEGGARKIAKEYVEEKGWTLSEKEHRDGQRNPMHWTFQISVNSNTDIYEGGGTLTVDALDGHIWEMEEMIEYMYDYNNVL